MLNLPDEVEKWLKENAYAIKGQDAYFVTDFPQDKQPDYLIIPVTNHNWKALRNVILAKEVLT